MPNRMSADPRTTRSQDAQVGGALCIPPSAPEAATKIAVSAASPNTQPPRNARLVGRGRGVCSTRTAGMIDSGEIATTSASGVSTLMTDPQLVATGSNLRTDAAIVPPSAPGVVVFAP